MSASSADTIAAIATPLGRGGVGIIRLSGSCLHIQALAEQILGTLPKPRYAAYRHFRNADKAIIDDGLALYFPAPHSFTGEHVLELQGHGGQVVLDMLLRRCVQLGARLARPGEFSERAFLNDKLDLAQAEAIADLIDSSSEQAARSALRSLQGEFSGEINTLRQQLIELRVYVEAALDFPDEEVDFLAEEAVTKRLQSIKQHFQHVFSKAQQGSLLREGMHLVLAGQPNAGKSSLLNALAGTQTAIVTEIAGTTRDVLREQINLDGMPLHIVDTAGLRESNDPVERIGIERAWEAIEKADLVLLVIDDALGFQVADQYILDQLPANVSLLKVFNKVDLSHKPVGLRDDAMAVSAKKGQGIDLLKSHLREHMGYQADNEGVFIARRRHLNALERCREAIERAEYCLLDLYAGELMAEELRLAQEALGEITGEFTADDLLGEIFSSFCIGK